MKFDVKTIGLFYVCHSTPSFESYEGKDSQHSYMTQGLLQELDKPKAVLQALLAIKDCQLTLLMHVYVCD